VTDADALVRLETLIQTQQPAAVPWLPVTDYSEPARKAAEGPHADLILRTFAPTHALDVGCGFNYLAAWVNARAGHTVMYGMDKDNPAADFTNDITGPDLPYLGGYDLVVCREVLEHLTVRDIVQAVRNLCALSSRYLYITTRFNPAPTHLLDVATSDDLDPTHISMLNQDFLRTLFVLEGFTRRADLESALDWRQYGRVLAYERA
jgi:hypothetical protein